MRLCYCRRQSINSSVCAVVARLVQSSMSMTLAACFILLTGSLAERTSTIMNIVLFLFEAWKMHSPSKLLRTLKGNMMRNFKILLPPTPPFTW